MYEVPAVFGVTFHGLMKEKGSTTHGVEGLHEAYQLKLHDPVNDGGTSGKEMTRMIGTSDTKLDGVTSSKQTSIEC